MIKNNEVRLGNLFRDELTDALLKTTDISEGNIQFYVVDRSKYPLPDGWKAGPIPLTPEILEKAGFESFENRWTNPAMYGTLVYEKDGWVLEDHETSNVTHKPFSAVHQLQNLFYTLAGEELNIEL